MKISLKHNKFVDERDQNVVFNLSNCCIIDYSEKTMKIRSKSIDKLCPLLMSVEKENGVDTKCLQLEEHGIVMTMHFINNISLRDFIDKRCNYNIECRLYGITNNSLSFKILKISDRKHVNEEIPSPDYFDVLSMKNSLVNKIQIFTEQLRKLCHEKEKAGDLEDLVQFEDNFSEFIRKNI
jgi:hypothetical protein